MQTFDGLNLYVRAYGPSDAPLTVFLAHCWTADTELWHYQVRDLLGEFGHRIQIVTWDHRGHGLSDHSPLAGCTVTNLGRDFAQLIDTYAPDGDLVFAGHSIGGMTMMALAEQRPDLVERVRGALFLATSSADLNTVTLGLPEMGPKLKAQLPRMLGRRANKIARGHTMFPTTERQMLARFLFGPGARTRDVGLAMDQLLHSPSATMEGFLRDMLDNHHRTSALAAYGGKQVTVMVGDRDLLTPVKHGRAIASAIPGSRFIILPRAGHMLPLERETAVSATLIQFVTHALNRQPVAGRHR